MPTYREYNARLTSMGGMRRVTSTMKMVAASHLHRAQAELKRSVPYGQALTALLQEVGAPKSSRHRLLAEPAKTNNCLLVTISSNRGLCGASNANVQRAARRWIESARPRFQSLRAMFVGHKSHIALRRDIESRGAPLSMPAHPVPGEVGRISRAISRAFLDGHYDEVHLAYNRFVSPMVGRATVERVLPVPFPPPLARAAPPPLREPDSEVLLERILLQWFDYRVFEALLHGVACEHAARMIAMDNATTNLRRLESELTLLRNRARQASITKELAEIVGGAEALA